MFQWVLVCWSFLRFYFDLPDCLWNAEQIIATTECCKVLQNSQMSDQSCLLLHVCERYERLILLSKKTSSDRCVCQLSHKEVVKQQLGDRMLRTLHQFFTWSSLLRVILPGCCCRWWRQCEGTAWSEKPTTASRNHFNPLRIQHLRPGRLMAPNLNITQFKGKTHLNQTSIFGFQIKMWIFQRVNDQRFWKP